MAEPNVWRMGYVSFRRLQKKINSHLFFCSLRSCTDLIFCSSVACAESMWAVCSCSVRAYFLYNKPVPVSVRRPNTNTVESWPVRPKIRHRRLVARPKRATNIKRPERDSSVELWEETKTLLEFCCFCELNEVLGPVTLGDEWLVDSTTLAGLRRCLRAGACTCHREKTQAQEWLGSDRDLFEELSGRGSWLTFRLPYSYACAPAGLAL